MVTRWSQQFRDHRLSTGIGRDEPRSESTRFPSSGGTSRHQPVRVETGLRLLLIRRFWVQVPGGVHRETPDQALFWGRLGFRRYGPPPWSHQVRHPVSSVASGLRTATTTSSARSRACSNGGVEPGHVDSVLGERGAGGGADAFEHGAEVVGVDGSGQADFGGEGAVPAAGEFEALTTRRRRSSGKTDPTSALPPTASNAFAVGAVGTCTGGSRSLST